GEAGDLRRALLERAGVQQDGAAAGVDPLLELGRGAQPRLAEDGERAAAQPGRRDRAGREAERYAARRAALSRGFDREAGGENQQEDPDHRERRPPQAPEPRRLPREPRRRDQIGQIAPRALARDRRRLLERDPLLA